MRTLLSLVTAAALSFANVASTAVAQAVDSAALTEAKALMDKMGMVGLMRQVAAINVKDIQTLLTAANPGKAQEVAKVLPLFAEEFDKHIPLLIEAAATVYATHFTPEELAEVNAFYDRPVGRKLVSATPKMMTEMQSLSQVLGVRIAKIVLDKLRPELEKRDLKITPQKT